MTLRAKVWHKLDAFVKLLRQSQSDEMYYDFTVFDKTLDVLSTYMGAREDFEELILYMQTHFKDFAYQLDECAKRWVPIDYLMFIHDYDSRFEK